MTGDTDGLHTLTEREKDTLRRLARGHDAKSIARDLALSVHTVNERLRDARRKLGVSSSREAARRLVDHEMADPDFPADTIIGVSGKGAAMRNDAPADRGHGAHRIAWFSGGMLIMSLIIAMLIGASVFHGSAPADTQTTALAPVSGVTTTKAAESASLSSAQGWMTLVDGQHWEASWRAAAGMFRSQVSAAQWESAARSAREPLGPVLNRSFRTATRTNSLPGVPSGDYEVVTFQTRFARKEDAVETLFLVREAAGWKVAAYFVR